MLARTYVNRHFHMLWYKFSLIKQELSREWLDNILSKLKMWISIYAARQFLEFNLQFSSLCHVWLFVTPWTVACQAPLSMGISRQEYWSGLPFPSPRGSSWPKDRTYVSCIAGRFFTAEPYVYISYIYTDINISVYSHSKSHLVMEYNLLCMVLDSACYHLVDIYSINIHKEYWSVVFLLCTRLVLISG